MKEGGTRFGIWLAVLSDRCNWRGITWFNIHLGGRKENGLYLQLFSDELATMVVILTENWRGGKGVSIDEYLVLHQYVVVLPLKSELVGVQDGGHCVAWHGIGSFSFLLLFHFEKVFLLLGDIDGGCSLLCLLPPFLSSFL